jgi:hypothetical protein
MTSPAVREAIIKSYGEWALGYLEPIGERGRNSFQTAPCISTNFCRAYPRGS